MTNLHDALHAMPWWLLAAVIVLLSLGTQADTWTTRVRIARKYHLQTPPPNTVDNVGSWLCLVALVFGCVVGYWPT